jgi:protein SCO1/2
MDRYEKKELPMPDFSFNNQFGEAISHQQIKGKYVISAFFFSSCTSLCPKMATQMQRVQNTIGTSNKLIILYHNIETNYESPRALKGYGEKVGAKKDTWHLLSGSEANIKRMAAFYLVRSEQDKNNPGRLLHDGTFILVGPDGKKMGYYNGADSSSVNLLIEQIKYIKIGTSL